ncbi:group I intron endonuclease [Edaphobacter modestus]|uniref:Group I intron endonuclease n=1 Tax=Edaphobacter modestus TaxID=388466 RepID=A0A4Q7YP68_9BACT|nr:group I intron endonuclease [Edaphobacter modestus]
MLIPGCDRATGIYCITNTQRSPERKYIGSSKWLRKRIAQHFARLRRGAHDNPLLQADWLKYGGEAFAVEILEYCPPEALIERETAHVTLANSMDRRWGYNIRHPKEHGHPPSSRKGIPMSEEQKQKIAQALRGRRQTPEQIAKSVAKRIGQPSRLKGRTLTPEHREKLSAAKKVRPKPAGFGEKVSKALTGRIRSEEHCRKISEANKGKPSAFKGKQITAENKLKMAEGRRQYWAKKRERKDTVVHSHTEPAYRCRGS